MSDSYDPYEQHKKDLKTARSSGLWDNAVTHLRKEIKQRGQMDIFKSLMRAEENNMWPASHHMLSGGMAIRNWLRQNGYGEDDFGVMNLDNCYAEIIYEAVWEETAPRHWEEKSDE